MTNEYKLKIVFLGDLAVGKTAIISRYKSGTFNDEQTSTLGAAYQSKVIPLHETDSYIKLELWDTSGEEKFQSVTQFYYRDADVIILVYDITRYSSFQKMNYWLEQIRNNAKSNVLFFVVGNKIDLGESQTVKTESAKQFAVNNGAFFELVSAKSGIGINKLFKRITEEMFPFVQRKQENPNPTDTVSLIDKKQKKKKKKTCCD